MFKTIKPKSWKDTMKSDDNVKRYPTFRTELSNLPKMEETRIGTEVIITLKTNLMGIDTIGSKDAEFEIKGIKADIKKSKRYSRVN